MEKHGLPNPFGMRSQFENHVNFGKKKCCSDDEEEPQPQDQVLLKETQLDMMLASQKIDGRLGSLSRLRTSINFNEFIRLALLIAGTIIGFQNSLTLKEFLPAVVAAQQFIVSRRTDILDGNIQSVDPWSLYPQDAMKELSKQKFIEFIISLFILLLTLNYYRLVWKLTTLRDGMFRADLNWIAIAFKCSMVFVHSQAKWNYQETFQVGGQQDEEPQSLYDNRRIFYNDQAITAIMIVFRLGYFVPKIMLRLYQLIIKDVLKTKHRYIITEKTALLDTRNFQLKYMFKFDKKVFLVILIIQLIGFSCIYQILNWSSSQALDDDLEIKPSKRDEFYYSLFQASNMIFRQQTRSQMKTFFISDPPPEPVVEEIDPDIQYITADYIDPSLNETVAEEPEIVINTSYQIMQIYEENNALLTVGTIISFFGSLFFTTFLINMLTQIDRPMSSIRFKNIMVDILQNQRGLIRTYSSTLIQSYFRIRKYQRLCNFEGQGTIRPGFENLKIYKWNKKQLKENIGTFRYNKFLVRQYRERATGIDKFAVEYQLGPRTSDFRLHRFVQDSVKQIQEQIVDKMRFQTLVILNEKVNRNDLEQILTHQKETIQVLTEKLRAMQITNIFLNKIQTTYLKEEKFNVKVPLLKIDTFPEIISDTSIKNMSDKDFAIRQEDIDESKTEQNRFSYSNKYSVENMGELDTNGLKYKLQQMKKKIEEDLADDGTSHRQINIRIGGRKGRVGFAKGTNKTRKSKGNSQTPKKGKKSASGGKNSKASSAEKSKLSRRNTLSGERDSPMNNSLERKQRFALRSNSSGSQRISTFDQPPKTSLLAPELEKVEEVKEKVPVVKKVSPIRKMKIKKKGPAGGIFMGGMNQIF